MRRVRAADFRVPCTANKVVGCTPTTCALRIHLLKWESGVQKNILHPISYNTQFGSGWIDNNKGICECEIKI